MDLRINGKVLQVNDAPDRSLLSVLRDELDLTGAKYGCGEGQCGACTVLIDGVAARSCITPVTTVGSRAITTIEGLEQNGRLHPLQQAFLDADALQCGYCTPGMILSGAALLKRNPDPAPADIVRAMNGNVCRCGTYPRIIEAVRLAANRKQQLDGAPRQRSEPSNNQARAWSDSKQQTQEQEWDEAPASSKPTSEPISSSQRKDAR